MPTPLLSPDRSVPFKRLLYPCSATAPRPGRPNPLDLHHPNLFTTGTPLTAPDRSARSERSLDECIPLASDRPLALTSAEPKHHEGQSVAGFALAGAVRSRFAFASPSQKPPF